MKLDSEKSVYNYLYNLIPLNETVRAKPVDKAFFFEDRFGEIIELEKRILFLKDKYGHAFEITIKKLN